MSLFFSIGTECQTWRASDGIVMVLHLVFLSVDGGRNRTEEFSLLDVTLDTEQKIACRAVWVNQGRCGWKMERKF